jgi:hypothetical protein
MSTIKPQQTSPTAQGQAASAAASRQAGPAPAADPAESDPAAAEIYLSSQRLAAKRPPGRKGWSTPKASSFHLGQALPLEGLVPKLALSGSESPETHLVMSNSSSVPRQWSCTMHVLMMSIIVASTILSFPVGFWLGWILGNERLIHHKGSMVRKSTMAFANLEPQRHVKPV